MIENQKINGSITKEVVETLVRLMQGVIGDLPVKLILKEINLEASGKEIVYAFADKTSDILSKKASFAILRQVGRELAESIMSKHDESQWIGILQTSLNDLGFAQQIVKKKTCSLICNCVFYNKLKSNNLEPTEHSVCWVGWGFIEGFMCRIENLKGIQWVGRDLENNSCQFDYLPK